MSFIASLMLFSFCNTNGFMFLFNWIHQEYGFLPEGNIYLSLGLGLSTHLGRRCMSTSVSGRCLSVGPGDV